MAFGVMLGDVTSVNASARQVTNILIWHGHTRCALQHASRLTTDRTCLEVGFAWSATHRTWRASSLLILGALTAQADQAARRRLDAEREAGRQEAAARDADQGAAEARRRAAAARAAAGAAAAAAAAARASAAACTGEDQSAARAKFMAEAAACEAAAAAAQAEAAWHDAEAARLEAAAEEHRGSARRARALAAALLAWEIAARDAHGTGSQVLAIEEPVAREMYEGIQAAGGLAQVPGDKRYLTRARVGAHQGGARQ